MPNPRRRPGCGTDSATRSLAIQPRSGGGRSRVPGSLGTSGWSHFDDGHVARPGAMVRLLGARVGIGPSSRASVVVRVSGPVIVRIAVAIPSLSVWVIPRQPRPVLAVVDDIHGAAIGDIGMGRPEHRLRDEGSLGRRVDAVIIPTVGRSHVLQLAACRHPLLGDPLPISTIPIPAALHPERVRALA